MYPDLPLEIFTGDVTGTTIQNDVFFTNVEYIYSPTDQDTILSGPSRTSSMQESLQAFFPELANSIQSEESKRFSPRFENLYGALQINESIITNKRGRWLINAILMAFVTHPKDL